MGRIRTIKPSTFLDEELWDLGEETGMPVFQAFVGLWTQADREGRFEWKPRRLKAAILPYWEGDFSRVLDALTTRGFLVKYASQGREYGLVRTFTKHQVVNNRESASELPPPPDDADLTREARVNGASPTRDVHAQAEGKGKEGKGRDSVPPSGGSQCPHKEIVALYHETLPELTAVREWTDTRKKLLQGRWRESPERQSLDWWRKFFADIRNSDFLMGRTEKPFRADLEWIIRPTNFVKILEGKYDARSEARTPTSSLPEY